MSATDPTTAAAGRRPSRRKSGEGRADELSEDELAMASEAQASSGDWSAGPPPGKANAFWPSFIRMLSLMMHFNRSLHPKRTRLNSSHNVQCRMPSSA